MKKLTMMMMAASLLIGAASYARSEPAPSASSPDKMDAAKQAEAKGDLERARQEYFGAINQYKRALRFSPRDANLYNKLGIVQLQESERGAARKNFNQALKLDPDLIPAINNLGATALMDRKYKAAANYFKQALAKDETVAATHLNLAESWMGMGEVDRAMTEYARALELDADILTSTDEGVIAQVATPQQRARISYLIAKMYLKRGNVDGALESLRRAKELRYYELDKIYSDKDFASLWDDPRLGKIVKR